LETDINKGKVFELVVPIENFLDLPQTDFTMKVKYNEAKDDYRLLFENEIFKFLITLKKV
jgi:hypothetical protein